MQNTFSHIQNGLGALVGSTSKAVKWWFNDPLSFIVYSNGPVLSRLAIPLMEHVVNASLMLDRFHLWYFLDPILGHDVFLLVPSTFISMAFNITLSVSGKGSSRGTVVPGARGCDKLDHPHVLAAALHSLTRQGDFWEFKIELQICAISLQCS